MHAALTLAIAGAGHIECLGVATITTNLHERPPFSLTVIQKLTIAHTSTHDYDMFDRQI